MPWSTEPAEAASRNFGSFSHAGPEAASRDKGNQDFAFHTELPAPDGTPWVLIGVADGVGQATWSERAARHASAAFIEATAALFADTSFPADEQGLLSDDWTAAVTRRFHHILLMRLREDAKLLQTARHVDPSWHPRAFADEFWNAPDADRRILHKWLQTTLLAAALGPHGGFALFLGDGYARVDRELENGTWDIGAGLRPTRQISLELSEGDVRAGFFRLAPRNALRLGVLVATDGVSKSTHAGLEQAASGLPRLPAGGDASPLDRILFESTAQCQGFLERLSSLPDGLADVDNMSVAFGRLALARTG